MNSILIASVSALLGAVFGLNALLLTRVFGNQTAMIAKQETTDRDINEVKVMLAGEYVKRSDLDKQNREVMDRVIRFEERLDAALAQFTGQGKKQ